VGRDGESPRIVDKTAIGPREADLPGVLPFPCAIGSPSGAFLDHGQHDGV
jgi:hypothetical protein